MFIELHILQQVAPSNLNRDDKGTPKHAWFGSIPRARVSPQSWKAAMRTHAATHGRSGEMAVRTRELPQLIAPALDSRVPAGMALAIAGTLFAGTLKQEDDHLSTLLLIGQQEIAALTALAVQHAQVLHQAVQAAQGAKKSKVEIPSEISREVARILQTGSQAIDLALFGRMIAELDGADVLGAMSVGHAISTHYAAPEPDYFTGYDQIAQQAGMVGVQEYISACYYRYAHIDTRKLLENLHGDRGLADRALEVAIRSWTLSLPSGKQHAMAAPNPPSVILAVVRTGEPMGLHQAFSAGVKASADAELVAASALAMDAHWANLERVYGAADVRKVAFVTVGDLAMPYLASARVASLDALVQAVLQTVAAGVAR